MTIEALPAFWSFEVKDALARLGVSRSGLSSAEAGSRLRQVGPNRVAERDQPGVLRLLLRQFESPLVLILFFGAAISLVLREWIDASVIITIVMGTALLGFFHEHRASRAVAELRARLALRSNLLRDGKRVTLPTAELAPGDVILLAAGDLIPADCLILEADNFLVAESALTGESFPVEKRPGVAPAAAPLSARLNSVFLGSSVRSGTATALVAATGPRTEFGELVARLQARAPETAFQRGVRRFGEMLLRVMLLIVLFVLTINQLMGRPIDQSLLFAVALAVGLSPELLPAIITVTLSAGAAKLAQRGVIMRRLEAIESFGGMQVLCTDKTGTLTHGVVTLTDSVDVTGNSSAEVRRLGFLNAALESGIENPLDAAIRTAGEKHGLSAEGIRKLDEIPYDFIRRRLTIAVANESGGARLITKGAFTNVAAICTSIVAAGGPQPLDAAKRTELESFLRRQGEAGVRVLAVAYRDLPIRPDFVNADEAEMTFAGFLLFDDPPKADAAKTLASLAKLNVRVKVITGDNRYVSAHVAEAVGLDPKAMLTGEMIAQMKDEALWRRAAETDVFAEIDPQQKERIVRALKKSGLSVGYLGDGINDAPALHAADVGVSVEEAVDVARESADVVLMRPDLDVLCDGVAEGRKIFANTLKYIHITTSANFGNMISMALLTPFLPFLPLLPKQILLNNFLSDMPLVTVSTDNVDEDQLARPQQWNVPELQTFMVVFGLVSSVFDILTFMALLWLFRAGEEVVHTGWFIVSLLTEIVVVMSLRTHGPAWKSRPGKILLRSSIIAAVAALATPYLGELSTVFGFTPLSLAEIVSAILIVGAYLIATEAVKLAFYRFVARRQR